MNIALLLKFTYLVLFFYDMGNYQNKK